MGHILLMLAVERHFGRKIRFEAIERIRSVRDLQQALTANDLVSSWKPDCTTPARLKAALGPVRKRQHHWEK